MNEDLFDNPVDEGRSRDGDMPRNENENPRNRFAGNGGRGSRPRFNRESRVGSSSFRNTRSGEGSGNYGASRYDNYAPQQARDGENRIPQRRFFSPHPGGAQGYGRDGYAERSPRDNRWSKQRGEYRGEGNAWSRGYENGEERRPYTPRPRGGNSTYYAGRDFDDNYASRSPRPYSSRPRSGENTYRGTRPAGRGAAAYRGAGKSMGKKRVEYKEEDFDPTHPVRLNKFLANAGVCSRRDADKYIQAGVVSVNGVVVTELGTKVLRSDVVLFHDNAVKIEKKQYVLLNKPKGYVTTSEDPQNRKTVMDLVRGACPERIYPVGRLDRNTTGVLLLTNDGEMASKLTHPKFLKKKIYHVTLDRNVTAADLRQIAEGIELEDGSIKADAIEYASETDKKQVGIEIHSGKNRIVRRIFDHLGYHVVKLDRVYFAGLTKKNVRRGDWRYLTEKEVNMLRMGAYE